MTLGGFTDSKDELIRRIATPRQWIGDVLLVHPGKLLHGRMDHVVYRLFAWSTLFFTLISVGLAIVLDAPTKGGVFGELCRYDCFWYEMIATGGYHTAPPEGKFGYANWAFWPLFPLLVKVASGFVGNEYYVAAVIVNNLAILFSLIILASIREELDLSKEDFAWFCLFFLATPLILYLRIPYSEAIYNLFFVMIAVAWIKDRALMLALAGFGFTIARGTGVFLPVFLALTLCLEHRMNLLILLRHDFKKALAIAFMPLGFVLHAAQLGYITGDPLAFTHVHMAWQAGDFQNPFVKLYEFFFVHELFAEQFAIVLMGFSFWLSYLAYRRFAVLRPFILFYVFAVLMSFSITPRSYARYSLAIFIPYLALPMLLATENARWRLVRILGAVQIFAIASWFLLKGYMV